MNDKKADFEKYWKKFTLTVKGKLISESRKRKLTYEYACYVLKDALSVWASSYHEEGRWLMSFEKEDESKARLLREIILGSISFKEEAVIGTLSPGLKIILPVLCTLLTMGILYLFDHSLLFIAVSSLITLVLSVPASKRLVDMSRENSARKQIDNYMEQLNKYMYSIRSLID